MSAVTCGVLTRKGSPCALPLRGGKCPTHSCNLRKRNRKILRGWRKRDPEAFRAQRVAAGKLGYQVTKERHGDLASQKAADWRAEHPSAPEVWMRQYLTSLGISFQVEVAVAQYYIDFVLPDDEIRGCGRAIEMNGHQSKPSFGERFARAGEERMLTKLEWLRNEGNYDVFVFDWLSEREAEVKRLDEWLKPLIKEGAADELPF